MRFLLSGEGYYGISKEVISTVIAENRSKAGLDIRKANEIINELQKRGHDVVQTERMFITYIESLEDDDINAFLNDYYGRLYNKTGKAKQDPLYELQFYHIKLQRSLHKLIIQKSF
ncbi:MAG: hypothetical protein PHE54_01670 [Bacilli bacterium]|nr:hypothetical protein [Bacilli bacterium]